MQQKTNRNKIHKISHFVQRISYRVIFKIQMWLGTKNEPTISVIWYPGNQIYNKFLEYLIVFYFIDNDDILSWQLLCGRQDEGPERRTQKQEVKVKVQLGKNSTLEINIYKEQNKPQTQN